MCPKRPNEGSVSVWLRCGKGLGCSVIWLKGLSDISDEIENEKTVFAPSYLLL